MTWKSSLAGNNTHQAAMPNVLCFYCKTQLSFPAASVYIQCPKCTNTMNPHEPNLNYMNCISCGTLLSHPPSSLTIQCPQCLVIMQLPVPVNVVRDVALPIPVKSEEDAKEHPDSPTAADQSAAGTSSSSKDEVSEETKKMTATNASGFSVFCDMQRVLVRKQYPEVSEDIVNDKLNTLWHSLTRAEQNPYAILAAEARVRAMKMLALQQQAESTGSNKTS